MQLRRSLFLKLLQLGKRSGFNNFLNFPGKIFTDAGQLGQIFVILYHFSDVAGETGHGASRIPIGPNPEWIGPFNLQKIRHLIKNVFYIRILNRHFSLILLPFF